MEYFISAALCLAIAAIFLCVYLGMKLREMGEGMEKMAAGIAQLEAAVKGIINGR